MAARVVIPVFNSSRTVAQSSDKKSQDVRHKPRIYKDGPLPTQLSQFAPREARIADRIYSDKGPLYQLKLGSVELNGISLDEVLDYVSPLELETFENQKFVEEHEIQKIAEAEDRKEEEEERLELAARRAYQPSSKRIAASEFLDESDDSQSEKTHNVRPVAISGGRARPTYTHLYNKFKVRRRRKRDPLTGELIDFSDDEFTEFRSSEDDRAFVAKSHSSLTQQLELPKRRRRKRDPVTGELLPLSPRDERHSVSKSVSKPPLYLTKEVVEDSEQSSSRGEASKPLSMGGLSISEEPEAKRLRLKTHEAMRSQSPIVEINVRPHLQSPTKHDPRLSDRSPFEARNDITIDLTISDDDLVGAQQSYGSKKIPVHRSSGDFERTPTKAEPLSHPVLTSSAAKSSPELGEENYAASPTVNKIARTSIVHPSANDAVILDAPAEQTSGAEQIEDSNEDDEFEIETILAHGMSNPKTHPSGLGLKPVMLYRVKWAGYDEPTWEPLGSFGDIVMVEEYHMRNGLKSLRSKLQRHYPIRDDDTVMAEDGSNTSASVTNLDRPQVSPNLTPTKTRISTTTTSLTRPSAVSDDDDDSDSLQEGEYEIDSIISHHLSDPRTHPPGLGKVPIMLYQVKWKGYQQTTWEPAESFEERNMVIEYRLKVGLSGFDDL